MSDQNKWNHWAPTHLKIMTSLSFKPPPPPPASFSAADSLHCKKISETPQLKINTHNLLQLEHTTHTMFCRLAEQQGNYHPAPDKCWSLCLLHLAAGFFLLCLHQPLAPKQTSCCINHWCWFLRAIQLWQQSEVCPTCLPDRGGLYNWGGRCGA